MRARLLTVPGALLLAASLASCGDDSPSTATDPSTDGDVVTTECEYVEGGPPAGKEVDLPDSEAPAEGTVEATMATSIGDFQLSLDAASTPCTVNSFVSLAEQGYFDQTRCHRIATSISILQCGDPSASGSGGPGYFFADELTGQEKYTAGTLAMANSGADTNGSQFFILYGDAPGLPPNYTVFGTVDNATVDAVAEAARAGTDDARGSGDGAPNTEIAIDSVTVG